MQVTELTNEELLSDLLICHNWIVCDKATEQDEARFYELLQEVKDRMALTEELREQLRRNISTC